MTSTEIENQGLLRAFWATVTTLENLVMLSERLCVRLREGGADDPEAVDAELVHIEEQLRAAKERLPKVEALIRALSADPKIH